MDDKIVTITYKPDLIKPEDLQKSIKELGYEAELLKPIENENQNKDQKPT
jgi:hypothetical protein